MLELVTDVIDDFMIEACADLQKELLCCVFPAGVLRPTNEEFQMVLADLQRGQTTLSTLLAVKTGHLKKLLWLLLGLATTSEDKAREVARQAMYQYDTAAFMEQHHPLSRKLLVDGIGFRQETFHRWGKKRRSITCFETRYCKVAFCLQRCVLNRGQTCTSEPYFSHYRYWLCPCQPCKSHTHARNWWRSSTRRSICLGLRIS